MYISHQPSGGRGEYELAGEIDGVGSGDLLDVGFRLDAGPFGLREMDIMLTEQGGKRRFRTTTSPPGIQVQRQVAAIALLPESTRDASAVSGGRPVAINKRYIIDEMHFTSLVHSGGMATVRLGDLILTSNRVGEPRIGERVSLPQRLDRVKVVHDRVEDLPAPLRTPVSQHRDALASSGPIGRDAERAVREVMKALDDPDIGTSYIPKTDPLPVLEAILNIGDPPPIPEPSATAPDEVGIRRREASILRMQRVRGASAARFRKGVQAAYRSACAFCGLRLPSGPHCARPGVDAAHILPYGDYDLDVVPNGLCLCKIHHWAFDEQMLTLRHDGFDYIVEVSDRATAAFSAHPETLLSFQAVAGKITQDRLPLDPALWPSPTYLARLYEDIPAEP